MLNCGKERESDDTGLILNTDEAVLAGRVTIVSQALPIALESGSAGLNSSLVDFSLTLVAETTAPQISGDTLQANDVFVDGTYAYVAYNFAGEKGRGGIEVFDISKNTRPALKSELLFSDSDINGLAIFDSTMYAVGALPTAATPAFVRTIGLTSHMLTTDVANFALTSFAGTSVAVDSKTVYAMSGDTGALALFERGTMTAKPNLVLKDARSVRADKKNNAHVLTGQTGVLHIVSTAGVENATWKVGGATIPESKSTLEVGKTTDILALGDGGVKIVCVADGVVLSSVSAVSKAGIPAAKSVTNAATARDGLFFTANGEAGVFVYALQKSNSKEASGCDGVGTNLLGSINFGSNISANHVFYRSGVLYVATGLGGLKIITVDRTKKDGDDKDFDENG